MPWRSYPLGVCRKPKLISSWGLGHPNPYHTISYCGIIPCLITLVGSARYLITLLRYTPHFYSVELYSALILCCGILYFYYIAGLYPILTHYWCESNIITLLCISQIWCIDELNWILTHCWGTACPLHCRAIPTIKTMLTYTLTYYIAEMFLIL